MAGSESGEGGVKCVALEGVAGSDWGFITTYSSDSSPSSGGLKISPSGGELADDIPVGGRGGAPGPRGGMGGGGTKFT